MPEWWMCLTCAFGSQAQDEQKRDAEHLLFDPAHEPNWVED